MPAIEVPHGLHDSICSMPVILAFNLPGPSTSMTPTVLVLSNTTLESSLCWYTQTDLSLHLFRHCGGIPRRDTQFG